MKKKLKLQPNPFKEGYYEGGRPRKYADTEEDVNKFVNRIIEYFDYIQGDGEEEDVEIDGKMVTLTKWTIKPQPATITGLSLFLGFCDKSSFYDYKKRPMFSHSIKRATSLIERSYEMGLSGKTPTGAIFALKNFGWKDKQEVEQTNHNITVEV